MDIIIESPVSFKQAKESVVELKVDNIILPVVGIDELIMMKKEAWRLIDRADVADLKVLKKLRLSDE